jgi:divalent metal cation (Fe/Co/Zn/Cd) transporter
MSTSVVEELRKRARRYSWLAFGGGILCLVLTVISWLLFGPPALWASWAIPILLIVNSGVALLPAAQRHPKATAMYYRVATVAAFVMLVGMVVQSVSNAAGR